MIPPRLVLTGSPQHLASADVKASLDALQHLNSGWKIQVFTDNQQLEFINKHYPAGVKESYLQINSRYGAARADLFRYLAIYILGGAYLDIKSTCLTPLDTILLSDDSLVISQWDNQVGRPYESWGLSPDVWDIAGGEYINWFFAAEPKNPILLGVIKHVLQQINTYQPQNNNLGRNGILRVTGPLAWSRAIISTFRQQREDINYRLRIVKSEDAGLVYSIFGSTETPGGLLRHRGIFPDHYSKSDEPVVLGNTGNSR